VESQTTDSENTGGEHPEPEENGSIASSPPEPAPAVYHSFLPEHKTSAKTELLCAGVILLTLVFFRLNAIGHIATHYLGGYQADAGLYVWLMKSVSRDLFSLPWYTTHAFYPYTQTLAWSDNFILPSLLGAIPIAVGLPVPLVYNGVLLLACFLSGYCTYRLCFRLTGELHPSLAAGILFMLAAPVTTQMGHPQLIFTFWFPLGMLCFFSFIGAPSLLRATLMALCVSGAFLTTVYYSLFLVVMLAASLFLLHLLRPHQTRRSHLLLLLGGGILALLPLIPFVLPYLSIRTMFGKRQLYESFYMSATGASYVSFSPLHILYSWTSGLTHPEAYLGAGIVLLLCSGVCFFRLTQTKQLRSLAVIFLLSLLLTVVLSSTRAFCGSDGCVQFRASGYAGYASSLFLWGALISLTFLLRKMGKLEYRLGVYYLTNRSVIAIFLFLACLFFALSLGPLGNPEKHQLATGPFRLLYEIVPGFNSMRAVSRAGILVTFCFSVLFAFAAPMVTRRVRHAKVALGVLVAIALVEGLHQTYPLEPEVPASTAFTELGNRLEEGDVVAILPLTSELKSNQTIKHWSNFAKLNIQYLHWLFPSGATTINGYSGQQSKIIKEYPRKLSGFPDRRSINAMKLLPGIRFVVYASQFVPEFDRDRFLAEVEQYPELEFLHVDEVGNYLFRLIGEFELVGRYKIRIPSHPQPCWHVQLMLSEEPGAPERAVSMYEHAHFGKARVAHFKIPADGKWQQYSLPLPSAANKARPFQISVEVEENVRIFMGAGKVRPITTCPGQEE
jgi:hypothetical protein